MHTQKNHHQLGPCAETSYGAVLCGWVSCGNYVWKNTICKCSINMKMLTKVIRINSEKAGNALLYMKCVLKKQERW